MMVQFDYYQATTPEYPRVLTDAFMSELPGAHSLSHGRGRLNYHHSANVLSEGKDTLVTVLHGGPNGSPHVIGTGARADDVAALLRRLFPDHSVSRVDACADILTPFPVVEARVRSIVTEHRVMGQRITNDDPETGDTYMAGGASSATRGRFYEKGKQLRSQDMLAAGEDVPLELVRCELQWRPIRDARKTASVLTASQVWGVSAWSHRVAADLFANDAERVHTRPRLKSAFERRCLAAVTQYGATYEEIQARLGSWEAVGPFLRDLRISGAFPTE